MIVVKKRAAILLALQAVLLEVHFAHHVHERSPGTILSDDKICSAVKAYSRSSRGAKIPRELLGDSS